ncbi:MAG TPA: trypsin-like peptidase domain-containing protein [Gemmatimonadaceae bacterium]|nr:trypsin-like peptidase domain-containing protein [Gemmatimonadaceae bacterium]
MMKHKWRRPLRAVGLAVASSVVLAGLLLGSHPGPGPLAASQAASTTAPAAAAATLDQFNDAFASTAAAVKPSVVYITATLGARPANARRRPRRQPLPQLPPELREFFDFPGLPPGGDRPPAEPRGGRAAGSGFIVSPDGYILTNSHVVDGASRVTVRLLDRREFQARVVGTDPNTDVAVLKVDAAGLAAARLGNSDAARVGEWVLAVGNPLGEQLTFTVTQGIISAKGRALDLPNSSASSIQDFIQTDAAINPGNSGGPLVNVRGEVIGINSAIASPTGYNAGYGFAVPIDLARAVMDQILKTGRVERAALGISVQDAGANDAEYVGLPGARGVLVEDFGDDRSPAKRAGLLPGDVIIAVDGQPVDYVGQLQERIAFRKPGDTVSLGIARKGGARATIRVPLERIAGDSPSASAASSTPDDFDGADGASVSPLGIHVAPLDPRAVEQLELPEGARGLVVTDVDEDGPAAGRLAATGSGGPDVIVEVEGAPVRTLADLRAAIGRVGKGGVVTLRVYNALSKSRRVERVRLGD